MKNFSLIKQGAEAKLYVGIYLDQDVIVKERFQKTYRQPELDKSLIKERTKAEARGMSRCKSIGIRTPCIYLVDFDRNRIYMEYLRNYKTIKEILTAIEVNNSCSNFPIQKLGKEIGKLIGKLHSSNLIHGDLTTSNILIKDTKLLDTSTWEKNKDVLLALIDFGLAKLNSTALDKAVDLYVMERAFESTHNTINKEIIPFILESYSIEYSLSKQVIDKLNEVRERGRKRTMVG